jgi:disulfide bond formation protein DsbB
MRLYIMAVNLRSLKLTPRIWFLLGSLGCVFLLSMGAYFQFQEGLEPCPLCISQRIAIFSTGLIFAVAGMTHHPRRKVVIFSILGTLSALAGGSISIRHLWIQHLPPDKVPECGPSLDYVLDNFPLLDTIKLMLSGTGDCAKVDWTMLGLSMPAWTLFAFLMLATLSLLQIWNHD